MNLLEIKMNGSAYWALIRWCAQELAAVGLTNEISDTQYIRTVHGGDLVRAPVNAEVAGSLLKLMVEHDDFFNMLAPLSWLLAIASTMSREGLKLDEIADRLPEIAAASPRVHELTSSIFGGLHAAASISSSAGSTELLAAITAAEHSGSEVILLVRQIAAGEEPADTPFRKNRKPIDDDLRDFCAKMATKLGIKNEND